ncbi:MAG: hypothetical protein AAGG48_14755 [Planctomycetota bacterium]
MKRRFVIEYVGGSMDGQKGRGIGSPKQEGGALPKVKIIGSIKQERYVRDDSSGAGGYWFYRYSNQEATS